jgi:hypothetical protein
MEPLVVAGIAAVVGLVLLRHFAARRVAARQGRFVWLVFAPSLFYGIVVLWVSIQVFTKAPLVGLLIAVIGVIYLAALIRFLARLSRSVTSTGPQEDLTPAIIEPLADYTLVWVGLLLVGSLVALVGVLIWGVTQSAR